MADETKPKPVPLTTQWRRADKGRRHRDIERAWTNFVWTLLTTAQTMLLGIFALAAAVKPTTVSTEFLVAVFALTLVELTILYVLSVWRRRIDARRAEHFEESVRASELQEPYDNNRADAQHAQNEARYREFSQAGEFLAVFILIVTVAALFIALAEMR